MSIGGLGPSGLTPRFAQNATATGGTSTPGPAPAPATPGPAPAQGTLTVNDQKALITEADNQGSGTKGDGLSTKANFEELRKATTDTTKAAKIDAMIANFARLDVQHGDFKGNDGLIKAEDATFVNQSFTYGVPASG